MTRSNTRLTIAILLDEKISKGIEDWINDFTKRQHIVKNKIELILVGMEDIIESSIKSQGGIVKCCTGKTGKERFIRLQEMCEGNYITFVKPGDHIQRKYWEKVCNLMEIQHQTFGFTMKTFQNKVVDPFTRRDVQNCFTINLEEDCSVLPIGLVGTFLDVSLFRSIDMNTLYEYDLERSLLINLMKKQQKLLYMGNQVYTYEKPIEFNVKGFDKNRDDNWYYDYKNEFLLPLLKQTKEEMGYVPEYIQLIAMYLLDVRVQAIMMGKNKNVGNPNTYIKQAEDILAYIDSPIYYNKYDLKAYMPNLKTKKLYYRKDNLSFISVIYFPAEKREDNQYTLELLEKQSIGKDNLQILICSEREDQDKEYFSGLYHGKIEWLDCQGQSKAQIVNGTKNLVNGEYVCFVQGGDDFGLGYMNKLYAHMISSYGQAGVTVGMSRKYNWKDNVRKLDYVSDSTTTKNNEDIIINLDEEYSCFPHFLLGTIIRTNVFIENDLEEGPEKEKQYLMNLLLQNRKVGYAGRAVYSYKHSEDWDFVDYPGIYEHDWYYKYMFEVWPDYINDVQKKYGETPKLLQYFIMYLIKCRFDASFNNRNKHIVPVDECFNYIWGYHALLRNIEDQVIVNVHSMKLYKAGPDLTSVFLKIKRNDIDLEFNFYETKDNAFVGLDNYVITSIKAQKTNILFINYRNNLLEIDGTISTLFPVDQFTYGVFIHGQFYEFTYNEMYRHTKFFGKPVYKNQSFHVTVPIKGNYEQCPMEFVAEKKDTGNRISLNLSFQSHFSRLSNLFANSYWIFGKYVLYMKGGKIYISNAEKKWIRKREHQLLKEMKRSKITDANIYRKQRIWYHLLKPFYKNKNIWMFYDKIYKGGDSSEYLYKYTCKQSNDITAYYLLDKNSVDYKRLKDEGYKPLVRGSLKHRMVFLYARMMIISNSTLFAFNDYNMVTSNFIKDLVDFHVVCVQHGLSVQRIAIAQNRLRDNIRLYFCASKYEIENLSKPVYGYNGYEALRLTGVPRYDGLVSNDKRQILISPTWRMQSARPVTKNEGVERDYNEDFVNTPYYEVYNSLINDPKLLEAAKQYGYRIAYVLHPIVSPQEKDFQHNEYVDIIPATGDMSYEKVFVESSLMVTDFSGVQFDFAYMYKPVVYLHHHKIPQHYEEGTYHYKTMAFGEVTHDNDELINVLIEYMKNDCKMKEIYAKRVDDFYAYHDQNNCERIYDQMIKYQKRTMPQD